MVERGGGHFSELAVRKSDFFRDLATADYMQMAEQHSDPRGITFDMLCGLFDAAILVVENATSSGSFETQLRARWGPRWRRPARRCNRKPRNCAQRWRRLALPRSWRQARSAPAMAGSDCPFPKSRFAARFSVTAWARTPCFPHTRTVLDIGGQDTKAIQVDGDGIVVSFQMNDRCAAGCGRYLGYIADEMNLGLHELGPLAEQSQSRVKINSTCTVFAGAELRERLSLGQRREDILAGLHRAIILRAMSLLARSGGVKDEFTFTGGVARNPAAVSALRELVQENYGERMLNISADSIYTGALGAALFALRGAQADA